MTGPKRVIGNSGIIYNHELGICEMPAQNICEGDAGPIAETTEHFVRINPAELARRASQGGQVLAANLHPLSGSTLQYVSALASIAGCSGDPMGPGELTGRPIANINPAGENFSINETPITGKLRQLAFAMNTDANSTMAWSVSDFEDENNHGTFAVTANASSLGTQERIVESPTSIPRGTSVARLDNGQSVVVFSRVQGEDAPSSLIAQVIDASGSPVGSEVPILPESIRSGLPEGQVVGLSDGFVVVYRDGEGDLGMAAYDLNGVEQNRQSLSSDPVRFQITRGSGDEWALAEITPGNGIRVRRFVGAASGGVDQMLTPSTIPSSPGVSVAMQDDGSMMVVWNAVINGDDPILEGAFLDAGGTPVGNNQILRNLVIGSGFDSEHINSHWVATDHQGNFILAYEENRNIFAHVYNGSSRDANTLTDISSRSLPSSGAYADVLATLDNPRVQNVDVRVDAAADGLLSFVYTSIFTGDDTETGDTLTLQRLTRRDFRINYE